MKYQKEYDKELVDKLIDAWRKMPATSLMITIVYELLDIIDAYRTANAGDDEALIDILVDTYRNDKSAITTREAMSRVLSELRRRGWGPQVGMVLVNESELAELRAIKNCVDEHSDVGDNTTQPTPADAEPKDFL